MNGDSPLTSRTLWASILAVATTQTETFKTLHPTLQWGIFIVVSSYILARGIQKGLESLAPQKP